jgi:C-terminal peptidase prc
LVPASATSTATGTAKLPITGAISTLQPAWIPPDCAGKPVATVIPATEEAIPTPVLQANKPIDKQTQLQIFDQTVQIVNSSYVYPDFNGRNWNAVVPANRAAIEKGVSTETFYGLMQGLIMALGDEHSRFDSPVDVAEEQAQLNGTSQFVGIGVLVIPEIEKGRISVGGVFPGSPAEHSGLQPHDSLLAVDGLPIVQNGQVYTYRVRGPECSAERLTVQSPGQAPRDIMIIRHSIVGDLPVQARLIPTTDGSKIGYIMLPSFFDEKIPGEVADALKNFGKLDGLIIDNRVNGGGSSDVVEPVLSDFASGTLGVFKTRNAVTRPLTVQPHEIENSQTVPLVVLIGKDTVSFGEIFSGALQDSGRAKIVGQPSAGNVEILHGHNFPDGSMMWLAEETFDPAVHHTRWEGKGVTPDVQAYADWDTFTFATDPAIRASLKLLGHQ